MFTIFVIMALVTTAMTAPIVWYVWVRHQKETNNLPTTSAPMTTDGNYLTDHLAHPERNPEYAPSLWDAAHAGSDPQLSENARRYHERAPDVSTTQLIEGKAGSNNAPGSKDVPVPVETIALETIAAVPPEEQQAGNGTDNTNQSDA